MTDLLVPTEVEATIGAGICVMRLAGVIDDDASAEIERAVLTIAERQCQRVLVDASLLTSIGGNGICSLARLGEQVQARGIELDIDVASGPVAEALRMVPTTR